MHFNDLQHFLSVRPGLEAFQTEDRVLTPFTLPGSGAPVALSVRSVAGLYIVHDDGLVQRFVPDLRALTESALFEPVKLEWIRQSVALDDEGRVFSTARDAEGLPVAIARVIEAVIAAGAVFSVSGNPA